MSMLTPADAIVGAASALAAMHKPKNNAFREDLIQASFFDVHSAQRQPNLMAQRPDRSIR
jgi:hypothetical protein